MIDLLKRLPDSLRIGILTNNHDRFEEYLHRVGIDELFDAVINTHRIGVAKPDGEAHHALDALKVEAKSCLFGDDLARNVEGAEAVGLPAHHFHNQAVACLFEQIQYQAISSWKWLPASNGFVGFPLALRAGRVRRRQPEPASTIDWAELRHRDSGSVFTLCISISAFYSYYFAQTVLRRTRHRSHERDPKAVTKAMAFLREYQWVSAFVAVMFVLLVLPIDEAIGLFAYLMALFFHRLPGYRHANYDNRQHSNRYCCQRRA